MKHVIILNADFAPSSLPPAQRVRLFARHLPEFGWTPIVVTTRAEFYETALDHENERLLPGGLRVVRTGALPAAWTRRLGFGDLGARSVWHHWRRLDAILARERVDAILIPVPPFIPMVLGRVMRDTRGVPYVVDYSDPWVTEEWRSQPRSKRLPKRAAADCLARALEPYALRRVSHVVGVSAETTRMVTARYPWLAGVGTTEIPFGGEPDDFEWVRQHPRVQTIFRQGDGCFHFTAASACTPAMHPPLRTLFRALAIGRAREPELFRPLRLHFVGSAYAGSADTPHVLPLAQAEGVADVVDEHPARVPYLTSLQLLLDSDALLATGLVLPHYTASKVFPYLLAEKPVLALFDQRSSAAAILEAMGGIHLVRFGTDNPVESRVEEVVAALVAILQTGRRRTPLNRTAFEPYTARAMTRRLAKVLDEVSLA